MTVTVQGMGVGGGWAEKGSVRKREHEEEPNIATCTEAVI